jgi:hypothetical protein
VWFDELPEREREKVQFSGFLRSRPFVWLISRAISSCRGSDQDFTDFRRRSFTMEIPSSVIVGLAPNRSTRWSMLMEFKNW